MALSAKLRAFKEVPNDIRQWSRWIRETLTEAISGTIDTDLLVDDSITFAKTQNIATDKVLGRATAGSGDIEELTCTAAGRALIDDAAASDQRTTLGLGTAAVVDTGTSGASIPLLSGANTWTLAQTFSAPPAVPVYAVAALPSAAVKGQHAFVTDANATMTAGIGAIVAAGGTNNVPVYSDGTNWRIG